MDFKDLKPIYLQIVDTASERILSKDWSEGERIPSVREFGMELGVNPNTVLRAYEALLKDEIIFNKRGIGYFASEDAIAKIMKMKKQEFFKEELNALFKKIDLLGISIEEILALYSDYKKE